MTKLQYEKYLLTVWKNHLKLIWCGKCKKKSCDDAQALTCCILMEKRHHINEWSFDSGLKQEQELDNKIKAQNKLIKKLLKESKNE